MNKEDTVNPDLPPPPPPDNNMNRNMIILVALIFAYLFNSNVIEWIYPTAETDYYVFRDYYYPLRNQVYSIMFFLAFLYMFFNSKKLVKSFAAFAVFVSFASAIDKCVYNFYQFKTTDWIVIGVGILSALYVYYYGRKIRRI